MFARVRGSRTVVTPRGAWVVVVSCASVAAVAAAPGFLTGCGSSSGAPSAPTGDASIDGTAYATVMTTGGGLPNPDAAPTNPFSSSGSSSGSSGSSSGGIDSGSSSGGLDSGSSSGSGDDGGDDGSVDAGPPYVAPSCNGTDTCDLRSNTCCLAYGASGLVGTCAAGNTADCPSNQATVHCIQARECGGGQVCCGEIITLLGSVQSSCQSIAAGDYCPYAEDASVAEIGVQLCKTDAECTTGVPCVHQTCIYGAVLDMCGLQSGSPLNCTETP